VQTSAQVQKNDAFLLHANTLLPLIYMSQEDFDTRYEVCRIDCILHIADRGAQEYVSNIKRMRKTKALSIPNPLRDLVTVPNFYAAFFGTINKDIYVELSEVVAAAAPRFFEPRGFTLQ
jgi:hypothetical protein